MDNPHPPGNRPMSVAPDPGRVRAPEPAAPRARRNSLADVLAAVMLLLATLTYLGRLVWGLSQPGYEIHARDFGSLLAAIIAIPAGVLLVTGMKPAVGRLTGALGAGAMLLFNAVNLTGGSVDDVIGRYGTWAAIPIVVATAIAIIALYRASWSPEEQVVADPARQESGESDSRSPEDEFDSPRYQDDYDQDDYAARSRREDSVRPARAAEQTGGVIGASEPDDEEVIAAPVRRSPFNAPPQSAPEPLFAESPQRESSEQGESGPALPERPIVDVPQEFPGSDERAGTEYSSLALPGMSLPASRPGPVEEFAPEPASAQGNEPGFAASGPAGFAPPRPASGGSSQPFAPESYVPERLTSRPGEAERFAPQFAEPEPGGSVPPQQVPFAAQTPPTEPFAQPDPARFHAATDGIPAVPPIDPPTTVLPRPDFTANPQQAPSPMAEPPQPGAVIGAPQPVHVEAERHDVFGTPPPFPPPGSEPVHPGHVVAPNMHAPETAPLNMGRPGAPQSLGPQSIAPQGPPRSEAPPAPPRPDVPPPSPRSDVPVAPLRSDVPPPSQRPDIQAGPPRNGFPDGVPPHPNNPQQGNPQQGSGPVHQPFGPPQNTPYPADTAQQNSLRLPGTEPFPGQGAPRQPVLRQPGGFLAPPPVEPEPAPGWQQSSPGHPHPDNGRPQLHDVSAADRPGPREQQRAEEDVPPPYLDHRQAPPKRLEPPTWAQEQ